LFAFVFWLLYRRKNRLATSRRLRRFLLLCSVAGCAASLIGIWGTISSSWLPNLIPNKDWTIIILSVTIFSFLVGLVGSELPRLYALVGEQRRLTAREKELRARLQESYNEQRILVQQQQELLAEVDRLYHEQAIAAVTDAVTGLPNHRAVIARIDEEVARCRRTNHSCAVLFVDLDHFKQVNDTWGHPAGDAVLHEVGQRLRASIRQQDFVGRYGGEEFAIVLTEVDIAQAIHIANKLCAGFAGRPFLWTQNGTVETIPVTGSFGVAVYPLHGTSREDLITHADNGMAFTQISRPLSNYLISFFAPPRPFGFEPLAGLTPGTPPPTPSALAFLNNRVVEVSSSSSSRPRPNSSLNVVFTRRTFESRSFSSSSFICM
jgi:diguanylate cyclase (GGDEF)-like protein